jgi:hypothetical protein
MVRSRRIDSGRSKWKRSFELLLLGAVAACDVPETSLPVVTDTTTDEVVSFERDVHPILADHCFACHGPDESSRGGMLRLDQRNGVFAPREKGRPPVVVPGNPGASLLYQRITASQRPMPPLEDGKPLSPGQTDVIRRWIKQGAPYPDRRFGLPAVRPAPPPVAASAWVRNPIDAFVLSTLESMQLAPAPSASPSALVRRVSLDLTGLPPSPEEVDAFVADPTDGAYEALVDRLLASPAYGEHRAHYWLDAARYADTHGFHMDNYRSIWPYRDYVITAFNQGKPYDRFGMEQLAGDLLPDASVETTVATGFVRSSMSTNEGGTIEAEAIAAMAKDRVDTLGRVFLGLTVGCASCHDHKFDPISQKEFYQLTAFFRNTTQPVLDLNLPNPPPTLVVLPANVSTLVTDEAPTPPSARILIRGRYDQLGEEVAADVPAVLPRLPEGMPRNRLGLAAWLFLPDHPLTARVTANRFWSEIFGTGIVRTTEDFGNTGEGPTHPDLLDWLAVELRESGWNVKQLFRLMVTSATYRQAAVADETKLALDPDNRFLSRGPRFRMDAELLRDLALAASGLLVRDMGGPSVKPYQPAGVWEAVTPLESNTYSYTQDTGTALYRRSLYTFTKRSAPNPSLQLFDAPTREYSEVRRLRTNTPLQALVTLNDVQFVEAARALGAAAVAAAPDVPARLAFISRGVLSRALTSAEETLLATTVQSLLAEFQATPADATLLLDVGDSPRPAGDPAELAAYTLIASTVLNLDEALNK